MESPQVSFCLSSKVSINSNAVSDDGIAICNSRFWNVDDLDLPVNLWEVKKTTWGKV